MTDARDSFLLPAWKAPSERGMKRPNREALGAVPLENGLLPVDEKRASFKRSQASENRQRIPTLPVGAPRVPKLEANGKVA